MLTIDGNRDLNPALFSFLLIVLLMNVPLFAQVDINGFLISEKYNIAEGFTSFSRTDFNKDNIPDIVLTGKSSKAYGLLEGTPNNTFKEVSERFFFYPVKKMATIRARNKYGDVQLFISRKERIAGLASFTKYGTLQLLNQVKLDSYPDNFIVEDFDLDGEKEAVLFGVNFNGLEIASEKKLTISSIKLIDKKVFSAVTAFDLDYDGYKDLITLDLLANSILIFYNDRNGNFPEQRSIPFPKNINNISLDDPDDDGFTDILLYTDKSVEVMRGDSVYSFSNTYTLLNNVKTNQLNSGYYNGDKAIDLMCFNELTGKLEVYLASDTPEKFSLYPVIEDNLIRDYKKTPNKNEYLILSAGGNFFNLKKLQPGRNNRFYPGKEYSQIRMVGDADESYLAISDTSSFHAVMYNLSKGTVPEKYYESDLNFNFSRLTFLKDGKIKKFVLWKNEEEIIEIFSFENERYTRREFLYSRLPVKSLKTIVPPGTDYPYLQVFGGRGGNLLTELIPLDRHTEEEPVLTFIDSNFTSILPAEKSSDLLHAWKQSGDLLSYSIYEPGGTLFFDFNGLKAKNPESISIEQFFDLGEGKTLTIFNINNKNEFYLFDKGKFTSLEFQKKYINKKFTNIEKYPGEKGYIITAESGNLLYKLELRGSQILVSEIKSIELNKINNYFVSTLNGIWYIVYIDSDHFINIKKLNEK